MAQGVDDRGRAEGRYANYFMIGHNAFEFVLHFGQVYEDSEAAEFHTRIVTGPVYAKVLRTLLGDAIAWYEREFGVIEGPGDQP